MTPERVAIVGIGISHVDYITNVCKVGDRKAIADEVWAINKMGAAIHCDAIFRMDDLAEEFEVNQRVWNGLNGDKWNVQDIWHKTLRDFKGKIYTCRAYPEEFPASVEYPLEEVINCVGSSYFNTGVAYAIAYAIYIGVKELALYGIDFSYKDRHVAESGRGCVEYHIREAVQRGIDIKVAQNSTLLDTVNGPGHFYGYTHPIEVLPDPERPGKYKVNHLYEKGKAKKDRIKKLELAEMERLLRKYKPDLLDAPLGAVQDESLKGERNDDTEQIHQGSD